MANVNELRSALEMIDEVRRALVDVGIYVVNPEGSHRDLKEVQTRFWAALASLQSAEISVESAVHELETHSASEEESAPAR
jgi:hypothetical protein